VVLWLQGGPGASSLYGMLLENGPVFINAKNKLELRQYSWHNNYNVLYIDSPVGAGFSFTDNPACYMTNQVDIGNHLFDAVRQFFQLFPELRSNPFYLTGESYAGKYIPALGHVIYTKRNSSEARDRINLQGLAIGNGVTDPIHQINYDELLYQLGFIDSNARAQFKQIQNAALSLIQQGNYLYALGYTSQLINAAGCLFNNLTGYTSPYNYLKPTGYDAGVAATGAFMLNSGIAKYLHVGNKPFVPFVETNLVLVNLANDILQSVAPWVVELANNYRVFIYSGQLDLFAGPTLTENYLSYLQFNAANVYATAPRSIWTVDQEIAGYVKKAGNLTDIVIRNAGHMALTDQPKWGMDMLAKLTGNGY